MNQDHTRTLDQLASDETTKVVRLTSVGADRRRMMDLGILPGTHVEIEMVSPLGDPTAYRIRGAIIALRREQAQMIEISAAGNGEQK